MRGSTEPTVPHHRPPILVGEDLQGWNDRLGSGGSPGRYVSLPIRWFDQGQVLN